LVDSADPAAVSFADLPPGLARDLTGRLRGFGSIPPGLPGVGSCSATVTSPDFFGACCCRNARHIELDVA
jgi:hypothetical protein